MMIFWICLIAGLGFAWLGIKKGLYVWIATLFNGMTAIYIGVLSTPVILKMSPEYSQSGYYAAATISAMALAVFVILQMFGYFYLLKDAEEYFPKLIDQVGGAVCGFLFSYFLIGFILGLVCIMPFSQSGIPSYLPQRDSMLKFSSPAMIRACNFIGAYSLECFDGEPEVVVEKLTTTLK
jgi:hypothetical protein